MEQAKDVRVPLAWLAELDDHSSPNALADAVGDRYLYRHNPVYAGVRDAALQFGYRFSAQDTPFWRDYQALALLTLYRIVEGKVIPYFDNGGVLQRLMERDAATALPPQFIVSNVKPNHAFHESAHCVAHSILRQNKGLLRSVAKSEREEFVIEAILAESFANTVEAIGAVFDMSICHCVFYALNSYMQARKANKDILARAAAELGEDLRFAMVLLSYFESNLATSAPNDATYQRIAAAAECPADQGGLEKEITDLAFSLNLGFRENTTPVYFELLGYKSEYASLTQTSWLDDPTHQRAIRTVAGHFADVGVCGFAGAEVRA
jgi:hypothetical protein